MIIPTIFEEELGFGYLARLRKFNGMTKVEVINQLKIQFPYKFIGYKNIGFNLCMALNMSPKYFFTSHTLFPVTHAIVRDKTDFVHGDPTNVVFHGLRNSIFTSTYIKTCSKCIAEDIELNGFSYYRRFHQHVGFDTCYVHSEEILEYSKANKGQHPESISDQKYLKYELDYQLNEEIIKNFQKLTIMFSHRPEALSSRVIENIIFNQSQLRDIRWTAKGVGILFSDFIYDKYPLGWLRNHIPDLGPKTKNVFHSLDTLMSRTGTSKSSQRYLLALNALFRTPSDVMHAIYDLKNHENLELWRMNPKTNPFFKNFDRVDILYVKHHGSIQRMAKDINCSPENLRKYMKSMGLPPIKHGLKNVHYAFLDFHKGLSLYEACQKNNVKLTDLEALIRKSSFRFQKASEKISAWDGSVVKLHYHKSKRT